MHNIFFVKNVIDKRSFLINDPFTELCKVVILVIANNVWLITFLFECNWLISCQSSAYFLLFPGFLGAKC